MTLELDPPRGALRSKASGRRSRTGALLVPWLCVSSPAAASTFYGRLEPTSGAINRAELELDAQGLSAASDSTVLPGSFLDFRYDTDSRLVTLARAHLLGSDLTFATPVITIGVRDLVVDYVSEAPDDPPPTAVASEEGSFVAMVIPTRLSGKLTFGGSFVGMVYGTGAILMSGLLPYDPIEGRFAFSNFTGTIEPFEVDLGGVRVFISGAVTLNFSTDVVFRDGFESGDVSGWSGSTSGAP